MYSTDVELALDTGRPLGIRDSDFDVEWPVEVDDNVNASVFVYTNDNRRFPLIRWNFTKPRDPQPYHF